MMPNDFQAISFLATSLIYPFISLQTSFLFPICNFGMRILEFKLVSAYRFLKDLFIIINYYLLRRLVKPENEVVAIA